MEGSVRNLLVLRATADPRLLARRPELSLLAFVSSVASLKLIILTASIVLSLRMRYALFLRLLRLRVKLRPGQRVLPVADLSQSCLVLLAVLRLRHVVLYVTESNCGI